jgi:hypothetical protein
MSRDSRTKRGKVLAWIAVGILSLVIARVLWPAQLQISLPSAQSSPVPSQPIYSPLFQVTLPSHIYPGSFRSIRDVDFKNLPVTFWKCDKDATLYWKCKEGAPVLLPIRNGRFQIVFHPAGNASIFLGSTEVDLAGVNYLSSPNPGTEYALAFYWENDVGGSSNQEATAQVFELAHGRLRVAQQIDWDLHYGGPSGPLDNFNEKTNSFTIGSSHYMPGDAHCCISAIDLVTYHWDGTRFVQTAIRTVLSDYGKREGKKLRP